MRAVCIIGAFLALAVALTAGQYADADAELDPSLMEARELEQVEDDDLAIDADDEQVPEAQNYHELAISQQHWRPGRKIIRWVCDALGCRHEKRSVDDEQFELRSPSDNVEYNMIGTEVELKPYSVQQNVRKLGASKVIQADLYQRRLAPGLPLDTQKALGLEQSGVVITLKNGRRFLVVKGNKYGRGKGPALIPARRMAPDWKKITSKAISNSVVNDFIAAAKPGYDVINNNGNQAAVRMMLLS